MQEKEVYVVTGAFETEGVVGYGLTIVLEGAV